MARGAEPSVEVVLDRPGHEVLVGLDEWTGGIVDRAPEATGGDLLREHDDAFAYGLATATPRAQESTFSRVEGDERTDAVTRRAAVGDEPDSFDGEQLLTEGAKYHRSAGSFERPQRTDEHRVELGGALMIDGALIDYFDHRHRRLEAAEICSYSFEDVEDFDLGDDVELAPSPTEQVNVCERLEARPDVTSHLSDTLCDGAHFSVF